MWIAAVGGVIERCVQGQNEKGDGPSMGLIDIGSVIDDGADSVGEPSSVGYDDDLFSTTPVPQVRWLAEARALLNEALEKTPPHVRGSANHRMQDQIESLARQQGIFEVTAELVGLFMGGMSALIFAEEDRG